MALAAHWDGVLAESSWGDNSRFDGANKLTFSFFMRVNANVASGYPGWFGKMKATTSFWDGFSMSIYNGDETRPMWNFRDDNDAFDLGSSDQMTINAWHHYLVQYDGTLADASRVIIYQDGSILSATVNQGPIATTIRPAAGTELSFGGAMPCDLQEFCIWKDRVITDTEIISRLSDGWSPAFFFPEDHGFYVTTDGQLIEHTGYASEVDTAPTIPGGLTFIEGNEIIRPTGPLFVSAPKHAANYSQARLPRLSQAITATAPFVATVADALPSAEQAVAGYTDTDGTIAQTLPEPTQAVAGYTDTDGTIAQTLPSLAQAIAAMNTINVLINESFGVAEAVGLDVGKNVSDTVNFNETYIDLINFIVNIAESFGIAEVAAKDFTMDDFEETLGVAEAVGLDVGKNVSDTVNFNETYIDLINFIVNIAESFGIAEVAAKDFTMDDFEETLGVAESVAKTPEMVANETVGFAEVESHTVAYVRNIAVSLGVAEAIDKDVTLNKAETVAFVERLVRNANAVISDIVLQTGDADLAAFTTELKTGAPAAYAAFEAFIEGQRDVKETAIQYILGTITDSLPRLNELRGVIDMEDVRDRGEETFSTAVKKSITFNRTFVVAPNVNATQKGGSTLASPIVSNVSKTGFDLELRDKTDALVTGTAAWIAEGY